MLDKIKTACAGGRVQWRRHALERMMERGISRERVKAVLMQGEIIALYQDDSPFPSLLLDGRIQDDVLHVVWLLINLSPIVMSSPPTGRIWNTLRAI